jgi:hypothetical protein
MEDGAEGSSQIYPEGLQEQCEQLDEVVQAMVCKSITLQTGQEIFTKQLNFHIEDTTRPDIHCM